MFCILPLHHFVSFPLCSVSSPVRCQIYFLFNHLQHHVRHGQRSFMADLLCCQAQKLFFHASAHQASTHNVINHSTLGEWCAQYHTQSPSLPRTFFIVPILGWVDIGTQVNFIFISTPMRNWRHDQVLSPGWQLRLLATVLLLLRSCQVWIPDRGLKCIQEPLVASDTTSPLIS